MGLIKAITGSASGVMGDQWKEYFYCEAIPADILVIRGRKRVSGRSSNRHGEDNIISNGSVIAINEGQCMLITEQGRVVDVCDQPGEYIYDISSEPSLFCGDMDEGIAGIFDNIRKRFTFGGDTAKDQRVYYVNTRELVGNKYGTPGPVPFRVVDQNIGLDIDISVRCFGEYSYRIVNPLLFYMNVCGNVREEFTREELDGQLKSELMTALQPAFARISQMGIRYSALPGHTTELADILNQVLSEKWEKLRGIRIVSLGVSSVKASEEDEAMLKELQRNAAFRNPTMAAAHMVGAQASAMQAAASNPNGAAMAFTGMGMAAGAGGVNVQNLFAMGGQMQPGMPQAGMQQNASSGAMQLGMSQPGMQQNAFSGAVQSGMPQAGMQQNVSSGAVQLGMSQSGMQQNVSSAAGTAAGGSQWTCACGTVNRGKFCSECGSPRPAAEWRCSCGTVNKGKFCSECGRPRP